MTTTYTFVNATAARKFAEYWNITSKHLATCKADTVTLEVSALLPDIARRFDHQAEAFNAASQSAREIGEGDDSG